MKHFSANRLRLALLPLFLIGCTTLNQTHNYPAQNYEPDDDTYCAFYIVAHPDDIELFMARNAWTDISYPEAKTVFIVFTAGDAGFGTGDSGTGGSYYLAREMGHIRAIRFWSGLNGLPVPDTNSDEVSISGKTLIRKSINNKIVIYNLHLPDGNSQGTGYASTGNQSLSLLRSGKIAEIRSIDDDLSLSYREIKDLIRNIIKYEAHHIPTVWVHILDEDNNFNPSDHSDHTATAATVVDALSELPYSCINIVRYAAYVNAKMPSNLSSSDVFIHRETWKALNALLVDNGQANRWNFSHDVWLGKQYFRARHQEYQCNF